MKKIAISAAREVIDLALLSIAGNFTFSFTKFNWFQILEKKL